MNTLFNIKKSYWVYLMSKISETKNTTFSRQELTNNVYSTDLNLLIADCVINYGLIMSH